MSNGPQDRAALLKTRVLIVAVVVGNVAGNALLSRGLHDRSAQLSPSLMHYVYAAGNPWAIAGVLLLSAWMIANLSLLSRADLSYALPVTGSMSYLLIALVGYFLLGETIATVHWIGIGVISVGVLLVHNVGSEAAIWTVGILMLTGLSLRAGGWRKLINAPIFALIAAVVINKLNLGQFMPGVATNVIHLSAACAIPLGLLLIGATLMEFFNRPRELFEVKVSLASSLLRLGVLPVLFLLLAKWLPCPDDLKRVIIVQAAMPAGILPLVIAKHYGGHSLTAVRVVIGTTVLGVFLIPLWLKVGLAWVLG